MNTDEALLRAILEDPADDTVRLAFADWLEEHGSPLRARFVRESIGTGVWVEGLPHDVYADYDEPTCSRITGLPAFDSTEANRGKHCTCLPIYRRGFVDEVLLPREVFFRKAKTLFTWHPITRVVLTDKVPFGLPDYGQDCLWEREDTREVLDGTSIDSHPSILPAGLFDALRDFRAYNRTAGLKWFATEQDALASASRECVRYGRKLCGLPPLPGGNSRGVA